MEITLLALYKGTPVGFKVTTSLETMTGWAKDMVRRLRAQGISDDDIAEKVRTELDFIRGVLLLTDFGDGKDGEVNMERLEAALEPLEGMLDSTAAELIVRWAFDIAMLVEIGALVEDEMNGLRAV